MNLRGKIAVFLGMMPAFASVGCTVPMVAWGWTKFGEGEVLGVRRGPNGERDVVFRLDEDTYRMVRVPAGWRKDPIHALNLDDSRTLLEREDLLVSREMASPLKVQVQEYTPAFTLDYNAAMRFTLQTTPNKKEPVDHTLSRIPAPDSYLAVVRFLDWDDHLHYVLFGYDPGRFRWVRLSESVDLGPAENRVEWAVALFPICLTFDAAALAADLLIGAIAGLCGGAVGPIFTPINFTIGESIFAIDSTDQLAPIPAPAFLK